MHNSTAGQASEHLLTVGLAKRGPHSTAGQAKSALSALTAYKASRHSYLQNRKSEGKEVPVSCLMKRERTVPTE